MTVLQQAFSLQYYLRVGFFALSTKLEVINFNLRQNVTVESNHE